MRRVLTILATLTVITRLAVAQTAVAAATAADEVAIHEVISTAWKGWSAYDAKQASSEYREDAYWINAFGIEHHGKVEISAFLTRLFASAGFKAATVGPLNFVSTTFIRPDVASIHTYQEASGQLTNSGQPMAKRKTHVFRIMTKQADGHWLTASFQVMDEKERTP